MPHFDAIIIGTGQAGPMLTSRLTTAGMKVAIIERKLFGGTCVNTGCIPTKTMVASAYAARMVARAAEFGVTASAGRRRHEARQGAQGRNLRQVANGRGGVAAAAWRTALFIRACTIRIGPRSERRGRSV